MIQKLFSARIPSRKSLLSISEVPRILPVPIKEEHRKCTWSCSMATLCPKSCCFKYKFHTD